MSLLRHTDPAQIQTKELPGNWPGSSFAVITLIYYLFRRGVCFPLLEWLYNNRALCRFEVIYVKKSWKECVSRMRQKNRACSANETESSENRADALHYSLKIRTINKKNETYIRVLRENLTFFANTIDKFSRKC